MAYMWKWHKELQIVLFLFRNRKWPFMCRNTCRIMLFVGIYYFKCCCRVFFVFSCLCVSIKFVLRSFCDNQLLILGHMTHLHHKLDLMRQILTSWDVRASADLLLLTHVSHSIQIAPSPQIATIRQRSSVKFDLD